ncbi:permease prefix domain 1-containing protein [Arthrobacter glacialis]|uniref:permease prefix domain 1-containing protein n=1 Tax=Arthrobacter glacialis TaxID=1664 RepID=UPI000CD43784|nr:permease prefix domain 1-containing protein [Arthrobacter glacialis]POH57254.1 hypothetical protein CVS28_16790 [Arthrobacter glacialis]
MTATLTERYIAATIKSLPPESEMDVRAELEASIADAIEARIEEGEGRADAERAVLTELGDPGALAAGFADRALHLIGPRYYLTWWRLLKLLLAIIPATAVIGVVIAQSLAQAPMGEIIGQAVGVGISTVMHVAFWVTVVFAILERTGADTGVRWDVDQLPEPKSAGVGRGEVVASLLFLAVSAGALLWDRFQGFLRPNGEPLPIMNPDLWPWSISGLFLLIAAEAALAVSVYFTGRWTTGLAIVNTVLAVLFVSLAVSLLARGELINPEAIAYALSNGVDADAQRTLALITGFSIVAIATWDAIDGWRKAAHGKH